MLSRLIDFIFPKLCVLCDRTDTFICPKCLRTLKKGKQRCPACGKASLDGFVHAGCRRPLGLDGLTLLYSYKNKPAKQVIKAIKYQFLPGVIDVVVKIRTLPLETDMITFVPLHWRRQNWRGFNQAEKLAERLGRLTNMPVANTLTRTRYTTPLAATVRSAKERRKEIKAAFTLNSGSGVKGKKVVLVDDVFTSGATMLEAAKVLKRSGANLVWGWALAG